MKSLKDRLSLVENHINNGDITIMIIGLGSVGTYLLDYIVSRNDESVKVVVVGRNFDKMEKNVNIVRISSLIRGLNKSNIQIESNTDLTDIASVQKVIEKYAPDIIVNSSRAYSGLKYGSISWSNIRAYGIWTPLAIRFTKNIMEACDSVNSDAIVINTSYSDAVIPWLKSAGKAFPDFGSGNLNHLVPRIKYAVANILGIKDFWNIEVMFAAGHFHDVCISKEGQTEGVKLPLKVYYNGIEQSVDQNVVFRGCKIPMPVDSQRNMMNASSNYRIIDAIISSVRTKNNQLVFSPGVFGNIGGYPVKIGYKDDELSAWIDESVFTFEEMNRINKQSMSLDGVEDIVDGTLIYTDDLLKKVKSAFDVELPKKVYYDEIEKTAKFIIDEIIYPQLNKG